MIGKSIGFLSFSAKRNRRFLLVLGELVAEFVMRNLRAKPQLRDVPERPTSDGVLSPGDKPLRFAGAPCLTGLGPGLFVRPGSAQTSGDAVAVR
jgi:hypothetical protein